MSFKTLIFFGLLAVALGFTLPGDNTLVVNDSEWVYGDVVPVADDVVLVRKARSPQGTLTGAFEHTPEEGSSANVYYNQQLAKNLELFGGAGRNFRYNENHAHAGLRYTY
ncbi:uncharacterized protein LOC129918378 [Episyrphus balteatus]|uniref:uncharacterized protein LOC129918378 n=1 Tax=Episyrphus balteatus TaxID=286459 RepID=UPI00248595F2|nr:uncharacterized protein LOC129918378 [Episyrphus balteatus]